MDYISKNLKHLRERSRLTKSSVARAIGKSNQSVASYENGGIQPPIDVLARLAALFEVKLSDLIERDLEKDGPSPNRVEEPSPQYGVRYLQREKELLHRHLDQTRNEIEMLHRSIQGNPEALAQLRAIYPELYRALQERFGG